MSSDRLSGMSQAQRDRLAFVELRLRFMGEIRRQDLVARFDIQAAAATRDIAQYKELAPGNMEYDTKGKVYVRAAWFRPLFDFPVERVFTGCPKATAMPSLRAFGVSSPPKAPACRAGSIWNCFRL